MQRRLALWLPNWPVQRLRAVRPELTGQALVVYDPHARDGSRVTSCSDLAWRLGVRPGMPLAEAQTLLVQPPQRSGVCFGQRLKPLEERLPEEDSRPPRGEPSLCCIPHEAPRDREALAALAEWCQQFSPLVGLDQTDEPDTVLLDVSGVAHLFGGEAALARRVVDACRARGWDVRVAIADTICAAWAVARWGTAAPASEAVNVWSRALQSRAVEAQNSEQTRTVLESPATSPVAIVPPGDTAALDALPVAALRAADRTEQQLQRLGLERLGQLRQLPRTSLVARFGATLARRLDQLWGAVPEVFVSHPAPPDWERRWRFDPPTAQRAALEYVLQQLLEQLAPQLRHRGHGVLQLECRLLCPPHPPQMFQVGLFQPAVEPAYLFSLLRLHLERLRLLGAVAELQLRPTATAPFEPRQRELFGSPRDEAAGWARFIERVSNRVGRERVVRPELRAEAQVELAYRGVPLTSGAETAVAHGLGSPFRPTTPPAGTAVGRKRFPTHSRPCVPWTAPDPLGPMMRPLWVFDPPQLIDVVALAIAGPPAMFHYQRRRYRVTGSCGPERIETGWWRGPSSRRDYYRVETESGQRFWLFRDLQDQRWFLHGEFA